MKQAGTTYGPRASLAGIERRLHMGMYCKKCEYDLRGQEALRCPECGRGFDPYDPSSYYDRPGRAHRVWVALRGFRIPPATLLTSAWVIWMVTATGVLNEVRSVDGRNLALSCAHMIVIQWKIWQQQDPTIRNFDRVAAIRDFPPLLGAYVEQDRIDRRNRLLRVKGWNPRFVVPTAIYALLMIPLVRPRRRWIAMGVLVICAAIIPALYKSTEIADALFPEDTSLKPSHAYLDDYVYIDGTQFVSSDDYSNRTIAVYDKKSFEGERLRIVGFASTHVVSLSDARARALFKAQGLKYPVGGETDSN